MANPTFVYSATTITFSSGNSYDFPYPEPVQAPVQAVEYNVAKTKFITDKSNNIRTFYLNFNYLSSSIVSSLKTFFQTTVTGAKTSFTFNDHNGTAYTVRWVSPWNFVQTTAGFFRGTIILEEE